MHGLYAEGIYRKSGVSSKIKELKMKMSEGTGEIDYESYNVHVLTNVLKTFLRDTPEPLLTFDRYDDFLRAADLSDDTDRVQTLLSLIKKLPLAHHALLERIVFHLALVAQREQYNRMSASSLAIVFAPCVLRTNRYIPAQDSLNDISRQTKCMETLITQKMLNVKSTLADIDTLDTAAHTATTRLSTLRSSKVFTQEEFPTAMASSGRKSAEAEEMILEGQIQEIKKEKALLTSTLPSLARASSDDDLLSTDLDGEGGSLDDLSNNRDKDSTNSRDASIDSALCSSSMTIQNNTDDGSCSPLQQHQQHHQQQQQQQQHHHQQQQQQQSSSVNSSNFSRNNSSTTFISDNDVNNEQLTVSYNLQHQNIDYFPTNAIAAARRNVNNSRAAAAQKSLDREQFMKCTTAPSRAPTCHIKSSANIVKNSNGSNDNSNAGNGNGGSGKVCELQRQKPIVMRSISGGSYESASSTSSSSILHKIHASSSSMGLLQSSGGGGRTVMVSSSSININNNNDEDDNGSDESKTKSQNIESQIMV